MDGMSQDTHSIVEIVPFRRTYFDGAVTSLLRIRESGGNYPSSLDIVRSRKGAEQWLDSGGSLNRFVALVDGEVVGHIQIIASRPLLTAHLLSQSIDTLGNDGFAEIAKLFVNPDFGRRNIGALLLNKTFEVSRNLGFQAASSVVDTATAALRLYESHATNVGTFPTLHGVNVAFIDHGNYQI